MELVRKKPGTSTELQASEPLVSGFGLHNCDCKGLSRELFAEMEGVKLELVILQKQVETNTTGNWQSEKTIINEELQPLELTKTALLDIGSVILKTVMSL